MQKNAVQFTQVFIATLLLCGTAAANEVLVIDDNLDVLPEGYVLVTNSSANATATVQIGDIGGSNGLIFDGTWTVAPNTREFAVGGLAPSIPTPDDFQLDPADVDGIVSIRWMLDLEVISDTMVPPDQGLFAQLVVFQLQPDFTVSAFLDDGSFVQGGETRTLDVTAVATDFGPPGQHPDFSPEGLPISFALQLGAAYPRDLLPDAFFVDGRMTADNWKVEVTGGAGGVFKNGFEDGMGTPAPRFQEASSAAECNCTAPRAFLGQPAD